MPFSPGQYNLVKFAIIPYFGEVEYHDISSMVDNFTITESIDNGHVRGEAAIYDMNNSLSTMNLRGEELVHIVYRDTFEVEHTDFFMVYAISNMNVGKSGSAVSYQMSFVSVEKYFSENKTAAFSFIDASIAGMAASVFALQMSSDNIPEIINSKEIYAMESDGQYTMTLPSMSPESTMYFLSRRAFSARDVSQSFKFFESREMFHFRTMDDLLRQSIDKPTKQFTWNEIFDNSDDEKLKNMMSSIITVKHPEHFNTIKSVHSGEYFQRTFVMDINNHRFSVEDYDYREYEDYYFEALDTKSKKRNSDKFIADHASQGTLQRTIIKDLETPELAMILSHKTASLNHLKGTALQITIYGRADLFAGDIIDIDIPEFTNVEGRSQHDRLSGRYFVGTIVNRFVTEDMQRMYYQDLILYKKDWVGGVI